MIQEITRKQFEFDEYNVLFPQIRIDNYDIDYLEIVTHVEINKYIIELNKQLLTPDTIIDYVDLMKFIDSIQIDVNKIKKNFKLEDWETNKLTCYKIIE